MPSAQPLPDLQTVFGFGVAGNFAGHLEQAGEAADFVGVGDAHAVAPKGIFPWFVPAPEGEQLADLQTAPGADPFDAGPDGIPTFLRTFPIDADEVVRPAGEAVNLQIEPEVGLLARADYDPSTGAVTALQPVAISAFNDCSIRRPGAEKISHKKNWGASTKGLSRTLIPLDSLDPAGLTSTYRLACFLRRAGETSAYGVDSAVPDYSYYGQTLLDWLVDRLAHQHGAPETPLEPVGEYLRAAGNPSHVLIGIGATRYTALGETTFLEVGDEAIVIVYNADETPADAVEQAAREGREDELTGASVLRQRVVGAAPSP
ncbi:MAG: hypothetical protein JHD16_10430 [Solirubrobacteraceae bacterium]|nr:hypothetical protein [Solirubrobacteraceae bacterium]